MSATTLDAPRRRAVARWRRLRESSRPVIYLGTGSCGRAAGAVELLDSVGGYLEERQLDAQIVQVGCIGPCYLEPLLDIQLPDRPRLSYANMTPALAAKTLDAVLSGQVPRAHLVGHLGDGEYGDDPDGANDGVPRFADHPMLAHQVRIALRNCGIIDPEDVGHYLARGGYSAIEQCLDMTWQDVVELVKLSGLRGRGGAGFPTWQKWTFCRKTGSDQRYLVCNADEGDPGAFMNRSLIEGDPHAVLEGMLIAAYAIGASRGFIYIRAEYPLAIRRLRSAIAAMRKLDLLGDDILGTGFSFDIDIKEGAGAFVCGEETALIASIEGRRGMPRTRPPFPAVSGLWGKPTIINNVETLATLPAIVSNGAGWYAGFGTASSKGTKSFQPRR